MMNSPRTPQSSLSSEIKELIANRNILTTRSRMKVLSALEDIEHEEIIKRQQSLRAQTIQEILTSEVSYMKQLKTLMEFFMKPLLENQMLTLKEYNTLFENIETLYNVSEELLKELQDNPENIAKAFCKLAPFFKLYSVYAYNYKRALVLLQSIQQNNKNTSEFIANQELRPEVNNKLSALLITPIQRIPRYKLLLQEVLRHTPSKQKDYNDLQASLIQIEKVASHVNALVAEYEDTQKLLELQKHITGSINLIKPGRKLIRQGSLMRVSRKGNSSFRRHFVLLSDTLLYCKGDPENSLTVCCLLPLNKCRIERIISNGLFKVVCMHETLLLYSENGDSEAWIETLQEAVKKYIECRQTLRKDSSSRMPVRNMHQLRAEEDTITRRYRKKRPLSTDSTESISNTSNIVYVNRDTESDDAITSNGFFSAIKRLKKNSSEDASLNNFKFLMDEMKKKSTENVDTNNFFHQTRTTLNNSKTYEITHPVDTSKSNSYSSLAFKNVSKFICTITSSVTGFFKKQ